jgi:hypothetical protein
MTWKKENGRDFFCGVGLKMEPGEFAWLPPEKRKNQKKIEAPIFSKPDLGQV